MSDRILVATRKGLFTLVWKGEQWAIQRADFLAYNVPMVLHDQRDGAIYAALAHGHFGAKVHRSDDDGATWQEIASPIFPESPAGAEPDKCPMRGIPIPWKVELIWSLEAGGPDQPGRLWCGTVPGGLFVSTDRGESWQLVESLWNHPARKEWFGGGMDYPGIHSICVDPRDSRRLLVGISCGGVWETKDLGETWRCSATGMLAPYMPPEQQANPNVQDPHRLVMCAAQPNKLWVQHHSAVYRSTDGAATWQEVKAAIPSGFGFAVAVHPKDGDTAWFVPAVSDEKRITHDARVVVSRTKDGGRSFELLTKGLPQEHAYDIAFRHCLDVDETGQRLAFGSTTGSLWATTDGGVSWETVSTHLPPVYCVRFA